MKRFIGAVLLLATLLIAVSWGYKGHRTVALIADNHLTPQAKAGIADLLNGESLADASTWADEVRNRPEYKNTSSWHFVNVPLGLTFDQFEKAIKSQTKQNLYSTIETSIDILNHKDNPKDKRAEALKFLIHLVGDACQPMHVAREEDKGGNTVQVQFDGKGTNVHTLWDSKLMDKQGLTDVELTKKIDYVTAAEVKSIQKTSISQMMYGSYILSAHIYSEVAANNKLGDDYYNANIGTVNLTLKMAGIKLAGILNGIFKDYPVSASQMKDTAQMFKVIDVSPQKARLNQVEFFVGQVVTTEGKVYGIKELGSMVLVNVGADYPNQLLTVVLRGDAKKIANDLKGKTIAVTGKVSIYKNQPQIEIADSKMIIVQSVVGRPGVSGGK